MKITMFFNQSIYLEHSALRFPVVFIHFAWWLQDSSILVFLGVLETDEDGTRTAPIKLLFYQKQL